MRLFTFAALLASSALIPAAHANDHHHSHWRLFVADSATPIISVIELETGETVETFDVTAPATLYASPSGQGIFAVQGSANRVDAFFSGIEFDDHGDHSDLRISAPAAVDLAIEGDKPTHFVEHAGYLAVYFDGSGKASILSEHNWLAGTSEIASFDSGKPHHGVAVPFHGGAIVSRPVDEDGKLPSGFLVFNADGALTATIDQCADVHGEATSGRLIAFGCSDGVLIASGTEPEFTLLSSAGLPEGRVGSLLGGKTMEFFLGNFGARAIALIEPEAETPIRVIDLPGHRLHFILNGGNSRLAYLLLADGSVHEFDAVTARFKRSAQVTGAYATDGGHGAPMPRLAQAGDVLLVSDPAAGKIHKLDLDTFALTGAIELGGAPASLVAVGGVLSDH